MPEPVARPVTASAPPVVYCREERFKIMLTEAEIAARIAELGAAIDRDYADRPPILVGVLNGAFMFLADLMRAITVECEVDFLKLSSYGAAKVSSGTVTELKRIDADLTGRDVIVVEDIVDTGLSMQYIVDRVMELEPKSLRTATLLHKPDATRVDVQLDYVGFEIENLFVLGYGLDYGQLGRNLPAIYVLDADGEAAS